MSDSSHHPSVHAAATPDRLALVAEDGTTLTYAELEDRSCRVANLLRSLGIGTGGHVAVLVENRLEYFELAWGALRIGAYLTPINWHLTAEEAAYIVDDCGATVLFASAGLAGIVGAIEAPALRARYALGGDLPGFERYDDAVAGQPGTRPDGECEGQFMFYSSGTTGRPKGIVAPNVGGPLGAPTSFTMLVSGLYRGGPGTTYLSPAPLYHAAPSGWTNAVHRLGGTVVVMDRFDPVRTLELIERHRVTHVQFVPTHLVRLLKLDEAERSRADLSSLEVVVHAAAPCPPDVKRAAIEWLGPIVHEYYSGSEGVGFCAIDAEEWLAHPGSVGRSLMGAVHVVGPTGEELPVGEEGQLWFEAPQRFAYHGDPDKTREAHDDRGWSTLGDVGWVDADGYVYLTDRVSNMIISGGVNIYPREVEDALIVHPAVADVAAIGVPHPDMGEAVRAVVQVAEGVTAGPELAEELLAFSRARIARFKCPTSVVFVDELPRLPSGKIARRLLPEEVRAAVDG